MHIRALETVARKKKSGGPAFRARPACRLGRDRLLHGAHIDEDGIQPVVQDLVEHADLDPWPHRFTRRADDADSSFHIVEPTKNSELFIGGQPGDVLEYERRRVSRSGKIKRLSGPPSDDRTPKIQAQHVEDDAGRFGVPDDQHIRARHRTNLKISTRDGPDDSSFFSK